MKISFVLVPGHSRGLQFDEVHGFEDQSKPGMTLILTAGSLVIYSQLVTDNLFQTLEEGVVVCVNCSGKLYCTEVFVPFVFRHIIVASRVIDSTGEGAGVQALHTVR